MRVDIEVNDLRVAYTLMVQIFGSAVAGIVQGQASLARMSDEETNQAIQASINRFGATVGSFDNFLGMVIPRQAQAEVPDETPSTDELPEEPDETPSTDEEPELPEKFSNN